MKVKPKKRFLADKPIYQPRQPKAKPRILDDRGMRLLWADTEIYTLRTQLAASRALHIEATNRNVQLMHELNGANAALEDYVKSFDEYRRESNKTIADLMQMPENMGILQAIITSEPPCKPWWKRSLREVFAWN